MSKRKLLLADDSITIQKVVNLTFADEGIEVISVGDGDSAMQKFDEFMPDLVMADVNMPGLTGYEICQIIKQNDDTRGIPVILLVGSFEPFDEEQASRVGADDYLTKPFQSIRQLVNKVTELLNQRQRSSEAPESEPETAPRTDTFADTLEFEKYEETQTEFGDAGMDDEMIETSPANEYVSESSAGYQAETTIDYAKTQPLSADDLKGFSIIPPSSAVEPEAATTEYQAASTETVEAAAPTSEPPDFDEEARKLEESSPYYQDVSTGQDWQNQTIGERSWENQTNEDPIENESVSAPQVDYYLPPVEEFDKELTTAETLEPEVSYEIPEPRTADFSQISEEESNDSEQISYSTEETSPVYLSEPQAEYEAPTSDETSTETAEVEETPQAETNFTEDAETSLTEDSEAIPAEETAPIAFEESEPETEETELEPAEETAPEAFAETETVEEPAAFSDETAEKEIEPETIPEDSAETQTEPIAEDSSETEPEETEPETIAETPVLTTETAPSMVFDDGDLLELPPLVEETGIRPQPQIQQIAAEPERVVETVAETVEEPAAETELAETPPTVAANDVLQSFPPELIEAIAQRVAEKISGKAIQDIAWEVVPQMTELIIKKMAEEKLKES